MTLEIEKLTKELEKMAQTAVQQRQERTVHVNELLETLHRFATAWETIDERLALAQERADPKYYRAARPLNQEEPLDAAVPPPAAPLKATIIATDGSQIMPDRHASFLYYLINVGGIIYFHGNGRPPGVFSEPEITYLGEDALDDILFGSGAISVKRDLQEIGTLAEMIRLYQEEAVAPSLGIVDQRLLYWPIGGTEGSGQQAIESWLKAMTKIRHSGALLAGYIDRPGKYTVVTLLQALAADLDDFERWRALGKGESTRGLNDVRIFNQLLQPGERSAVFVDISRTNERFGEDHPDNQICFFYLNPGRSGNQIARVDIPMWVARDSNAVATVHGLLYDQCRILGDYPYVLARADEMAVVGRQEKEELNFLIELTMQRQGIVSGITAKQTSKELARGGKTRYVGP